MDEKSIIGELYRKISYFKSILIGMPGCVYWKDRNGTYLGCNRIFLEMVGLETEDELIGKTDYDLCWSKQADMLRKHDQSVIESGIIQTLEEEVELITGEKLLYSVSKAPLKDEANEVIGVVGTSIDITYRKKLEDDLTKSRKKAESANEAKSEFIANISHDIRTPITGILGLAQSIEDTAINEDHRKDAALIIKTIQELLKLLNEVIEVISLDNSDFEATSEAFSLRSVAEHNFLLSQSSAKHKNIKFNLDISKNVPDVLKGNKSYVDKIMTNLISNAVKFTETGEINIFICAKKKKLGLLEISISIKDTGIGIPKDQFKNIFDNFTRLSPSYSGIYKGNGIGLYQVKKYLSAIGGAIDVYSEIGVGSEFVVTIPFEFENSQLAYCPQEDQVKSELKDIQNQRTKSTSQAQKVTKVLLVEDNQLAARMAQQLICKLNCSSDHVESGEAALDLLREEKYDLIFMDIGLPGISGIDAAMKIRGIEKAKAIPIVALTGHGKRMEHECISAGMQKVIAKPITAEAVKAILSSLDDINSAVFPLNDPEKSQVIDILEGAKIANGNETIAKEMVASLVKTLPDEIKIIRESYEKNEIEKLYDIVHKFYGGLCYCGVPRLKIAVKSLHDALYRKCL